MITSDSYPGDLGTFMYKSHGTAVDRHCSKEGNLPHLSESNIKLEVASEALSVLQIFGHGALNMELM